MPFEHFTRLSDDKQRDILNAALEEFVQHGYDLASTNRIVERAGIAKGTLFKYFSTKEALFLYLCEQCSAEISEEVSNTHGLVQGDFFDLLKFMAFKEIVLSKEKPGLFALFQHMAKHPEHPVYARALQEDQMKSKVMIDQLLSSLNRNSLRPSVSLERVLLVVTWVLEGLKQKILLSEETNEDDWQQMVHHEIDTTLELLKHGITKSR